jgi:stearoyl-CoA desaturase (delta-9 desaturase)
MRGSLQKYRFGTVLLFVLIHAGALAVLCMPFSRGLRQWTAATYAIRMFGVTAGYHRYFSHRSYKLDRSAQFAMAALAQSSGQKDVLWWAAHHRQYHRYADGGPAEESGQA